MHQIMINLYTHFFQRNKIVLERIILFFNLHPHTSLLILIIFLKNINYVSFKYNNIYNFFQHKIMQEDAVKKVQRIVLDLNKSGMQYLSHQQYKEALQLLKKAEKIIIQQIKTSEKDPIINKLVGITFNNLGCYYKKTNKPKVALGYLKRALEIEVYNVEDWISTAGTHLNMCAIFSYLGKHNEAADHASLSIRLLERQSKRTKEQDKVSLLNILMISYYNLGVELQYLKQNNESRQAYKKGLQLARTLSRGQNMVKVLEQSIDRLTQVIQNTSKRLSQLLVKKKEQEQKGHYEFMRKNRKHQEVQIKPPNKRYNEYSQPKLRINSTMDNLNVKLTKEKSQSKINRKETGVSTKLK